MHTKAYDRGHEASCPLSLRLRPWGLSSPGPLPPTPHCFFPRHSPRFVSLCVSRVLWPSTTRLPTCPRSMLHHERSAVLAKLMVSCNRALLCDYDDMEGYAYVRYPTTLCPCNRSRDSRASTVRLSSEATDGEGNSVGVWMVCPLGEG